MSEHRMPSRRRLPDTNGREGGGRARRLALLAVGVLVSTLPVLAASSVGAATADTAFVVSNNQIGATGVIYSFSFTTTATPGTVKSITFAIPGSGVSATVPTIDRNYGLGSGSVSVASDTITYTLDSAQAMSPRVPVFLAVGGLTNGTSPGSYATTITTLDNSSVPIDTWTTPDVTLAAVNTAVTVNVAKSLTFTVDTTAFDLEMDPSVASLADQHKAVGLTVRTNANSGYTLSVADTGLRSSSAGAPTIAPVSAGKGTSKVWPTPPAQAYGYTVTATGATADPSFSGSKYAGFTSLGEQIAGHGGPTGNTADSISVDVRVAIDYTAASGVYQDTLTYTVTPDYS